MNPQKTNASGGRKGKVQKDSNNAPSEQNNNVQAKKHPTSNNINTKDSVNNNTIVDSQQPKAEKEKSHSKPTAEQIRIAQITELKTGNQDPTHEKVIQLMEMTERSEEDACLALYECDNDVGRAVIYLLENLEIGAVMTTSKKKKNKSSTADEDDSTANIQRDPSKDERPRHQKPLLSKGKPERGGRIRPTGESHNDRPTNARPRPTMNSRRGGFSGTRGGRGGRSTVGTRGGREPNFRGFRSNQDQQEIDNWDPASTNPNDKNDETWGDLGDWDNEEYTGSLSDTKVFTPSAHPSSGGGGHDISAPPGLEQSILQNASSHSEVTQYSAAVASSASVNAGNQFDHSTSSAASQIRQALEIPQTLTAEQSQYFNTLSSQNNNMVQYGFDDQTGVNQGTTRQQQQRTRARLPPPSKIPSTAVEMPGDGMNVYLGVQFGELDFGTVGTEENYESEKYSSAIDQNANDDFALKSGNGVAKSVQSGAIQGLSDSNVESLSTGYQRSGTGQTSLDQLNVNQKSGYQHGNYGSNYSQTSGSYGQTGSYGYNQTSFQQNLVQNSSQAQPTNGSNGISSSSNTNSSAGYMSNQYPSNQPSFSSQSSNFQNQSVYSSNNSDANSVVSGSTTANTVPTSTINSSTLGLNTKSTAATKTSQSSSATTTGTTNTVGSSTANSAGNVVQNIPLVSSFIQPGYYQQSPYLHFEDMQLVQPRMTPISGYYEYQTPTSLGTGRDAASASNLASVAYPMTADGRFARTDNNSSPVQSQQTGSSQQLMNIPPYAYFYGTNVMPSGFQQFPQIYSQMQVTNPNAGQFAKQTAYNSGYGSTSYDTMNQTNQEYNKTAYQSAGQQSKGSNQNTSNSELTSSMYNKSHVALNKVNSYDKQPFHSATPPPFNLAGSQANSQTQPFQQHLYLQPMAPHHNINMHQPIHQAENNRLTGSRRDSNNAGQRQQINSQTKGTKNSYQSPSYWNTQN